MHSSMDKTQHNTHNNTVGTFIHGMKSNNTVNVESQSTSNGDEHTTMAQRSGDNSVGTTHDTTIGAQSLNFRRALNNFCRKNKVDIVALQEPRCSGSTARKTIKKLGFKNYVMAEARGFSGGIWLMWNRSDIQIQLIQNNFHFLHVQVSEKGMEPWLLTVIYASPRENERHDTWQLLRHLATSINKPWLVMGDFNEIAYPDEKKGGAPVDVKKCQIFNSWINDCNLLEVTTAGTRFTWRGPKWNGRDRVFKKLDRVLCNVDWRIKYHEGFAKVLPRVQSDHHPIIVSLEGHATSSRNRPFRFEAAWNSHVDFKDFLNSNWEKDTNIVQSLHNLTVQLKKWNKDIFGDIFKRKKEILDRLNGIQNSSNYGHSIFLENLEKELQDQLVVTLYQEECFWFQKSRSQWINDGDRNTKYYHSKTIVLAIPAPMDIDGKDTIGWGGTNTRNFTVKSAYENQNIRAQPIEGDWKAVWSWKGPHRIQTFMWMAAHDRLLTNFRRSKWGVGASPTCSRCDRVNETLIHVLRDCPVATQTWIRKESNLVLLLSTKPGSGKPSLAQKNLTCLSEPLPVAPSLGRTKPGLARKLHYKLETVSHFRVTKYWIKN
ncbi:unnamed protein product [Trifolium pratense]|uniref:Uncharacterized protein n=1 Tax=Trifolium pratense TaxID=57577 RepID=A0ACB0JJB0_TRIPR|nr:unnamed protein product [Trifolium pratense]